MCSWTTIITLKVNSTAHKTTIIYITRNDQIVGGILYRK